LADSTQNLERVQSLEVPLVVQLGERTMTVLEVTALVPGSIIELTKAAVSELDLLVNNRRIGRGLAVKVGENFGIRITVLGDVAADSSPAARPSTAADSDLDAMAEAMLSGQ
jgi:flagellar motor switch protein FliN/FliY